jgi:hypothetical protein
LVSGTALGFDKVVINHGSVRRLYVLKMKRGTE